MDYGAWTSKAGCVDGVDVFSLVGNVGHDDGVEVRMAVVYFERLSRLLGGSDCVQYLVSGVQQL